MRARQYESETMKMQAINKNRKEVLIWIVKIF